jgi:acyl-[acyl-carrier-protein] desaturase
MVGDMITEEALPTYENWLMEVEGVDNLKWLGTMGSSMDK